MQATGKIGTNGTYACLINEKGENSLKVDVHDKISNAPVMNHPSDPVTENEGFTCITLSVLHGSSVVILLQGEEDGLIPAKNFLKTGLAQIEKELARRKSSEE